TFIAFDLLALGGRSLVGQPYADRRQQLHDVLIEGPSWCVPEASAGDGDAFFAAICDLGLEGMVAKRADSRYKPGLRSDRWVKIKNLATDEFQVAGWLLEGGTLGHGGLLVGLPNERGEGLRLVGLIETGFGPDVREQLK